MGLQVLICDWTREKILHKCIRKPNKEMDLIRYKDMDFAFSQFAALDEIYDVILYIQDLEEPLDTQMQRQVFICDGIRENIQKMVALTQKCFARNMYTKEQMMIVYRDIFQESACEYVTAQMQGAFEGVTCEKLKHDCMDEAAYQYLQFHLFSGINHISEEMDICLKAILEFIDFRKIWEEKLIRKALKSAKRGSGV